MMKLNPLGAALAASMMILCGAASAQSTTVPGNQANGAQGNALSTPDAAVTPSGTMGGSGTLTPDSTGSTVTPQSASMPAEVVPYGSSNSYGSSSYGSSTAAAAAPDPSLPRTRAEVRAETRAQMHNGRIVNGEFSLPNQDKGAERGLVPYPY